MGDTILEETLNKPRRAAMGAFWVAPKSKFDTQQEDESVVLMLRKHPVTLVGSIAIGSLLFLIPLVISVVWPVIRFGTIPGRFVLATIALWYLLVTAYTVEKFLDWYYSVFIVTNRRLVDIDFVNMIYQEITTANLEHVEEPKMQTAGVLESMFDFGTVTVTTASKTPNIVAELVPRPSTVVDIISRLSRKGD